MSGRKRYERAISSLAERKENKPQIFSGILGVTTNGENQVDVPGRNGFVWVRLRNQLNELVQAFNDTVSTVFDLPVMVEWDKLSPTRYKIIDRDTGRYLDWGSSSSYIPVHGAQHSFNPAIGQTGGDIVWVYSQQFMPLLITPSGSSGAMSVSAQPAPYYYDEQFRWAGGTGIAGFDDLRPTGSSNARMLLIYLDPDSGNILLATGSLTEFANTITGTAQILPYMPSLIEPTDVPLAGVRLVTGTSELLWPNVYDLRDYFVHSSVSGSGGGGGTLSIYDDNVFVAIADSISFDTNLNVVATGSAVFVEAPISTYQRVGEATPLTGVSGTYWQVPDLVFASGSLAVFIDGAAQTPGTDYDELHWVSGTYQYSSAPATGTVHLVMYGVPCSPQIQPEVGSPSPSVSPSVSSSESSSSSASLSPSASESPSVSLSVSPSVSPSPSASVSPSASESASESPSISPSASESPSVSPSVSASESSSPSASGSPSPSVSPSVSPSPSASISPSASESPSISPSVSPSVSPSISPSSSESPSISPSASESPSVSPSISPSVSPSSSESASASPSEEEFALQDSDSELLLDSNSVQLLDSNG